MKTNHLFLTLILLIASVTLSWAGDVTFTITPNGTNVNIAVSDPSVSYNTAEWNGGLTAHDGKLWLADGEYVDLIVDGGTFVSASIPTYKNSVYAITLYNEDGDAVGVPGKLDYTTGKGTKTTYNYSAQGAVANDFYMESTSDATSLESITLVFSFLDPVPPATQVTFVAEEDGVFYALAHNGASVTSIEVQMVDGKVVCSAADQAKITWFKRDADDDWEDNGDYTLQTADDGKYLKLSKKAFSLVDSPVNTCAFWTDGSDFSQANTTISCTSTGFAFDAYHPLEEIAVSVSTFDNNVSAYTFSRTFNNTNYSTICLPYDVPAAKFSGFTLYNITGVHRDGVGKVDYFTMEESEVLEAGVPYIIQADAAGTVRLPYAGDRYTGSTRPVATGLVGNLTGAPFSINASDNAYILSQNEAHLITGTATANIAAYRAYLDLNSVSAPASTAARRVILGVYETEQEEVVTDLEGLLENAAVLDWSKPVYNLMGQRVSEGATGVLIQEGQKFMIR